MDLTANQAILLAIGVWLHGCLIGYLTGRNSR